MGAGGRGMAVGAFRRNLSSWKLTSLQISLGVLVRLVWGWRPPGRITLIMNPLEKHSEGTENEHRKGKGQCVVHDGTFYQYVIF